MSKDNSSNNGRWSDEEHRLFLQGLEQYGKNWKQIERLIRTRTGAQIRSHAQKYFLKVTKKSQPDRKAEKKLLKKQQAINDADIKLEEEEFFHGKKQPFMNPLFKMQPHMQMIPMMPPHMPLVDLESQKGMQYQYYPAAMPGHPQFYPTQFIPVAPSQGQMGEFSKQQAFIPVMAPYQQGQQPASQQSFQQQQQQLVGQQMGPQKQQQYLMQPGAQPQMFYANQQMLGGSYLQQPSNLTGAQIYKPDSQFGQMSLNQLDVRKLSDSIEPFTDNENSQESKQSEIVKKRKNSETRESERSEKIEKNVKQDNNEQNEIKINQQC